MLSMTRERSYFKDFISEELMELWQVYLVYPYKGGGGGGGKIKFIPYLHLKILNFRFQLRSD